MVTEFHIIIFVGTLIFVNTVFSHNLRNIEDARLPDIIKELETLIDKTVHAHLGVYWKNITRNKIAWDIYYDCLDKQFEVASVYRSLPPISITAMEGGTAKMNCLLCMSPELVGTTPSWYWFDSPLPEDDWILVDRKTGRMSLFGVRKEEAGQYECRLGSSRSIPYFLHVVSADSEVRLVRGRNSIKGPKPAPEVPLTATGANISDLVLFTEWSDWSRCSRCGKVGLRYRFGACSVRRSGLTVKKNVTTTRQEGTSLKTSTYAYSSTRRWKRRKKNSLFYVKRLHEDINITVLDELTTPTYPTNKTTKKGNTPRKTTEQPSDEMAETHLLDLFYAGLPCTSSLLPANIRRMTSVTKRKNEIMEAYCKSPCADEVFEVKDRFGRIIEKANNSGGVYSVLQGPPPVPPMPTRVTLFAPVFEPIIISCPGHLHLDIPFYWTVNRTKRLIPAVLSNDTNGRVTIDFRQQIIFKELEPEDGRLYVCWQLDSIAGVVRLVPFDPSAVKIDHHLMLIGITVILGSFLYLFARIYMNRHRAASVD